MSAPLGPEERKRRARERWKKAGSKVKAANALKPKSKAGLKYLAEEPIHSGGGTRHTGRAAASNGRVIATGSGAGGGGLVVDSSRRKRNNSPANARRSPSGGGGAAEKRKAPSQIQIEAQRIRAEAGGGPGIERVSSERARKNWKTARSKLKQV